MTQPIGDAVSMNRPVVLAGGLLIVAASFGMWPGLLMLAEKWSESIADSSTYSHGFLVALISAYLLFKALARSRAPLERFPPVLIFLVLGLVTWSLTYVADVEIGMWLLWPSILGLAFIAALGWDVAKQTFFPLGYLYFAIPVWDYLNGFLQSGTVLVVKFLLPILGVTAMVEGNRVFIPAGTFEIAGGCSGIHFFIVSLALAALYGHLYLVSRVRCLALALIAIGLALVTNWVRVTTIIYAGDATGMQHYLVTVDHYNFGWALFGVSLIPFFLAAGRLRPAPEEDPSRQASTGFNKRSWAVSVPILIATSTLLLVPAAYWVARDTSKVSELSLELPRISGWTVANGRDSDWKPSFPKATGEVLGTYSRTGAAIDVYMNTYLNQVQGRELIGYQNTVLGTAFVKVLNSDVVEMSTQDDKAFKGSRSIFQDRKGNKRVVLYWYLIGKNMRASDSLRAKVYQALSGMAGNHDAGLVAISSLCEGECDRATSIVIGFAEQAMPALEKEVQSGQKINKR